MLRKVGNSGYVAHSIVPLVKVFFYFIVFFFFRHLPGRGEVMHPLSKSTANHAGAKFELQYYGNEDKFKAL